MKKYIVALIFSVAVSGVASGQEHDGYVSMWDDIKYAMGIHVGLDIGAAVPFPLGGMGAENMSAVPKLNPSLGFSFTASPISRFSATAEVTYKQVGIDAKARVNGQQFTLVDDNGTRTNTEFRGTAHVKMAFSMLEVPVFVGYSFKGGRNKVFLGGYYSHIFKAEFDTTPIKGVVISPPDNPGGRDELVLVSPDNPVDSDVMPPFNDYMDNWDAGMLVGFQWRIIQRVNLSARVSVGFKDIFNKGENYLDYKMLHMRGTVVLSYNIFNF